MKNTYTRPHTEAISINGQEELLTVSSLTGNVGIDFGGDDDEGQQDPAAPELF